MTTYSIEILLKCIDILKPCHYGLPRVTPIVLNFTYMHV